jgi:hypothetical protein
MRGQVTTMNFVDGRCHPSFWPTHPPGRARFAAEPPRRRERRPTLYVGPAAFRRWSAAPNRSAWLRARLDPAHGFDERFTSTPQHALPVWAGRA